MSSTKLKNLEARMPWIMIVIGVIGFICAFVIMYDKLQILQNPNYKPSCSINPIISCGTVMQSSQAHLFAFPNPIIGLAAFPMIATMGFLILAGGKFKRWAWLTLQGGTVLGVLFVHWLFFESVYRIHALCPYCMGVWVVTIALFWYVFLYNIKKGYIKVPKKLNKASDFIQNHHIDILVGWYLIITFLILHHFWYYFKTVF